MMIAGLTENEEKGKNKNFKKLGDLDEQEKYAPMGPKYTSGKGVKRKFGESVMSDEVN